MTLRTVIADQLSRARLRRLQRRVDLSTAVELPAVPSGDALARVQRASRTSAAVVLVIPTIDEAAIFAGANTALDVAAHAAGRLDVPLRVLTMDAPSSAVVARARPRLAKVLGLPVDRFSVAPAWTETTAHDDDVWFATYWSTAHAIDRACARGVVARDRVVYLVQDHEPDFFPASVEAELAAATYHTGFRLLVNSEPLRAFLAHQRGIVVTPERTFRPALDAEELQRSAAARRRRGTRDTVTVGFYARPSKPRNAFGIGRAALQIAGDRLRADGVDIEVHTMGEDHAPFDVGPAPAVVHGRLPWAASFERLAQIDVLLSLQLTPHPSHPPLDQVASGGLAVTNEVGGTRSGLHPRLRAARSCTPEALATELVLAVHAARTASSVPTWDSSFLARLGVPLEDAIDNVLEGLR